MSDRSTLKIMMIIIIIIIIIMWGKRKPDKPKVHRIAYNYYTENWSSRILIAHLQSIWQDDQRSPNLATQLSHNDANIRLH